MAKPKARQPRHVHPSHFEVAPEVVDPRWLLKALGGVLAVAALFGYLTLCLLLYQGAWQLLLHPSAQVDRTPAAVQLPFQAVRFDAAATGRPRLSAWWIAGSSPDAPTLLYLHDGKGSLASTVDELALLHRAGVNLLAIDYRGFGASEPTRPNEARMSEDAAAALEYLVDTRHLALSAIVPYGVGLGAALAAALAVSHPQVQAVIADHPDPDAAARLLGDSRSRLLPVRLLLRDRFDVRTPLRHFPGQKLLLDGGVADDHPVPDPAIGALFKSLPDPKFLVTLPPSGPQSPPLPAAAEAQQQQQYVLSIQRFLDEALPPTPRK